MSEPPQASRPAPAEIAPIEHNGIRYIQDTVNQSDGDQNGGYLAAIDIETGNKLWRIAVYEVPDYSAEHLENDGLYFRSMQLVPGQNQLEIVNESGTRYLVDVDARSSTYVDGPPPESMQEPEAPAKPKPRPPD